MVLTTVSNPTLGMCWGLSSSPSVFHFDAYDFVCLAHLKLKSVACTYSMYIVRSSIHVEVCMHLYLCAYGCVYNVYVCVGGIYL